MQAIQVLKACVLDSPEIRAAWHRCRRGAGSRRGDGGSQHLQILAEKSLKKLPVLQGTPAHHSEGQEQKVPGEPASTESDTLAEAATH